jgi:hypothetical protein
VKGLSRLERDERLDHRRGAMQVGGAEQPTGGRSGSEGSLRAEHALRARFLERLLCALERRTTLLADALREGGAGELEQRRTGWGWAVANELAGRGGAPDRRETRGAAWLAWTLGQPGLSSVRRWPRLRPDRSDWRTAYGLVLMTDAALGRDGSARAGVERAAGAWSWVVSGALGPAPEGLAEELGALFGGELVLSCSPSRWSLDIPCEWWPRGGGGGG